MLNMDMVGRMRGNHLAVNGGDSAKQWRDLVEPACAAARVPNAPNGNVSARAMPATPLPNAFVNEMPKQFSKCE